MTSILGRMAAYGGKEVSYEAALQSNIELGPCDAVSFDTPAPTPKVAVPGQTQVVQPKRNAFRKECLNKGAERSQVASPL